jgi:ribosomal protein S20
MLNKSLKKSSQLAEQEIEKIVVIMDPAKSSLHTLNEIGSLIWRMADGKTKIKTIIKKICSQFEVEEEIARKDTIEFIRKLITKGLVILKDTED